MPCLCKIGTGEPGKLRRGVVSILAVTILFACLASVSVNANAVEAEIQLKAHDGLVLHGKQAWEGDENRATRRVVILVHGSGPQNMDVDVKDATINSEYNPFFRDLSDALVKKGFTVIRYNKRTYELNKLAGKDGSFKQSDIYKDTISKPLSSFTEDVKSWVDYVKTRFKGSEIYLLGHSQGSNIVLRVAHRDKGVRGVAVIGFGTVSTDTLVFEQIVHRPETIFVRIDRNRDGFLSENELSSPGKQEASLLAQRALLDLDTDGLISLAEFQAGNLSNLLVRDIIGARFRQDEAGLVPIAEVLKAAKFKIAFFQGAWDNMTPAYHTQAVEVLVRHFWKKKNIVFRYFPKLGHLLNPMETIDEIRFRRADPKALEVLATDMDAFFGAHQ